MNRTDSNERRGAERFQSLNLLSFYEYSPEGQLFSQGIARTLDLSESGALIFLAEKFINPDHVIVEIALAEEIIRVQAEIIEQISNAKDGWNIRIRFKDIKPSSKHRLASFILNLQ
jgi:hypothetical protein